MSAIGLPSFTIASRPHRSSSLPIRPMAVLAALIAVLIMVTGLPHLGHLLLAALTPPSAILRNDRSIAGFIALGGGEERMAAAAALAESHPQTRLIITGASDPELQIARRKIDASRLLIEQDATSTFENAVLTARRLGADTTRPWVLVTSESHMPRALAAFRKAGIDATPWPVPDPQGSWSDRTGRVAHEWGGLLAYWLQGRIDVVPMLWPAAKPPNAVAAAVQGASGS